MLLAVMAALRTCERVGLMSHVRQGGKGVCAFADAGSKFVGTELEKLQIVQTQVTGAAVEGLWA